MTTRTAARLGTRRGPVLALAVALAVVLALDVVWLLRFRWGYPTEWDESGYLAIGVRDSNALMHHGFFSFLRTIENQQTEAPLVPAVAAIVFALFGAGMGAGVLVVCGFMALLVVATYSVGKIFMGRWWAALAAATVGAAPVATDYSRLFHFSVPAAVFFTTAIWALLRSDRLRNRAFVVLCGLLLGLMVLSRTMTIAYLPAIAVAALLQAVPVHGPRRPLAVNALLGTLAGCAAAALWYVRSWRSVADYLRSSGYGSDSTHFGTPRSIFSLDYWTRIVTTVTNDLYLPLAAVAASCVLLGMLHLMARNRALWSRRGALEVATRPWFVLVVVVVEGYAVLTSSKNDGTAFTLPWLPALVILAVFAAARSRVVFLRTAAATAFVAVIVVCLAMKSGFVSALAGPTSVHVPLLGRTTVVEGKGIMQTSLVEASGYPAQPATSPYPHFHKGWLGFEKRVVRAVVAHARSRVATGTLRGFVATDSQILSNTSFQLAAALLGEDVGFQWLSPYVATPAAWRLAQPGIQFVVTTQTPSGKSQRATRRAARADGYRAAEQFTMPDRRRAVLWWRGLPTAWWPTRQPLAAGHRRQ